MTQVEAFKTEVEEFLTRSGMSATAFGRSAINDPNFVSDLREGRMPSLGLADRIYAFIRQADASAEAAA